MDDAQNSLTVWLTLSLAFDNSATLAHHVRQSNPCIQALGRKVHHYLHGIDTELETALEGQITADKLQLLRSEKIRQRVDQAMQWQQRCAHHHLIGLSDSHYPPLLQNTDNAPVLLYAKGSLAALAMPKVAIVGSRKASLPAIKHTQMLARNLARRGTAIVSGLAMGIDAAAHQGALEADGVTIAVAATEPESVYPRRHHTLAQRIVDNNGLILTEYPLGAPTLRWYFPRRNRIISGMSLGVVVAEAALPSGTLTTATHAMNQGREVMAVPGSVHSPQTKGCHALIKQGAALVETDQDVVDALGMQLWPEQAQLPLDSPLAAQPVDAHSNDTQTSILSFLTRQSATVDELMTHLSLDVSELATALGLLEIQGQITATSAGRYIRC